MDMALWVNFATERKVVDLCIDFHCFGGKLCLPQCLYECSSLRKLSLRGCNLQIRGIVKWDRLNSLKLSNCVVSEDAMNRVFSSSPQLETFAASCHHPFLQNWSIRSSSLKKLCIYYSYKNPGETVLTIWAPNLQVLDASGTPPLKYLLTDISSLSEVHLSFSHGSRDAGALIEALLQILPVIQHVVIVELSASCLKVLRDIKENYPLLPLLNVKLLTIDIYLVELSDIVGLFESFPKLQMLIIEWIPFRDRFKFDAEANILQSNLLQLRTVVITNWYVHANEDSFFEFIGFLLKHATMIEKMVIRREDDVDSEEMFEAAKQLMRLQRSFPSVELLLC